jgi:hypothetical protein
MTRKTEAVSERDGYTIVEVSDVASDGSAQITWIEIVCPNGKRVLCDSVDGAEAFIETKLDPRPSPER